MGDFLAPKRRDVVDRLRRRIEQYRCHHFRSAGRFEASRPSLFEQQKQDTQLLHQRWLENRAKKAAKQNKTKDGGGGGGGGGGGTNSQAEHRNLVTQKLKRKIDSSCGGASDNNSSATAETVFKFDDSDNKAQNNQGANTHINNAANNTTNVSSSTNVGVSGGQDGSQQVPHLSVQIVQQISTQRESPQTIHTNVTVSSTLQTRYNSNNNNQQGGSPAQVGSNVNVHTSASSQQQSHSTSVSASTTTTSGNNLNNQGVSSGVIGGHGGETSVHTSIECKQEPAEDGQCRVSDCGPSGGVPGIDIDELQDILDSIEKEDGDIPQDLIQELDKFNAIYDKVQRDSENNAAADPSASMFSSLGGCTSPGLCKAAAPFSDPTQQQQHGGPPPALTPTMFETAQAMGGLPIRPPPSHLVEPTGPAAETLKQMAAQHQHQVSAAPPYTGKSMDHYSDPYDPFGRSRNGYPSAYAGQGYAGAGTGAGYPGYGQSGYGDASPQIGQYPSSKPDLAALAYGTTKPLTHYPGDGHGGPGGPGGQGGQPPSSLQQLQNQVASHFSPGPMHITQTQHVQLAPGAQRVQLSQTQQVQMAAAAAAAQHQGPPPPGMTMSQQQSFSMASHMQGQAQGHGMPTARDMQFMQEKMRQQQAAAAAQQQQQYMNRPPPEYKMHPAARSSGPPYPGNPAATGAPGNGGSTTPLQTMQNMVNQTPAYPGVKGEAGGVMTQMSAVQSMAASVNSGGQHMGATMAQATQSMAYQQQMHPHRPPSYSPQSAGTSTTPNGVVTTTGGDHAVGRGGNGGTGINSNVTSTMGSTAGSTVSTTHHPPATATTSQVTTGYTSALMRNQRPPNVNVGPDGLNISQPRAHPGHPGHMGVSHPHSHAESWQSRAMMQGHMQGQMARGPGMGGSPVTTMMPPGYAHRPGSAGSVGPGMGGAGPMPPGSTHPMMAGGGVGVSGAQVMMQQSVQMTQRGMAAMRAGPGVPPPGMGHPQQGMPPHSAAYSSMVAGHSGAMQTQSNGTPGPQYPGPPPPPSGQDDFMHFLDQAQTPGFDSFDSMVSGSTPSDFNLFDEILSGGK